MNPKICTLFFYVATLVVGVVATLPFALAAPPGKLKIAPSKNLSILKLKDAQFVKARIKIATLKKPAIRVQEEWKDTVALGTDWLEQDQDSDGSWGKSEKTKIRDTERVLEALCWLEQQESSSFSKGIDWCRLYIPNNNDFLARQVHALALFPDDTTDLSNFLAQQTTPNGGFGYQSSYASDTLTSALTLRALTASGYEDPGENPLLTVIKILNYLLTSTNPDSAWGFRRGDPSALYPTLIVLEALVPYKDFTLGGFPGGDLVIKTKTDLALDWVLGKQQPDGGFGDEGSSNIALSAFAYHTLLQYSVFPTDNEGAIAYLLNTQEADGSWNAEDPYATASSLMALGRPDIAVTAIEKTSALLPNQTAEVKILVRNIGYVPSQPIPSSQFFLIVDGREIPLEGLPPALTFEENSTVDLNLILEHLPAGEHTIGFRVDYAKTELRKTNNHLEATFTWTDPTFVGPPPPSWVGATTSPNPEGIIINWLPSEGGDVTQYDIYFGGAPNSYIGSIPVDGSSLGVQLMTTPDVLIYFSVVAVNSSGERGDYSIETSAVARSNPGDYQGQVSGSLTSNGQPLSDVTITVYRTAEGVVSGSYVAKLNPGDYYITASKVGYEEVSRTVHLPDSGSVTGIDFDLPIINDGVPPSSMTGLTATPDDGEVRLTWEQSVASDFRQYNIYRRTSPFTNITGMSPLMSLSDRATTAHTDSSVVNGISYHYAITAVDLAGNELTAVSSIGPVKPNSSPVFSSMNTHQRADGMVQVGYDITDQENQTLTLNLEYWTGAEWQPATHTSGIGTQAIGANKVALWEAKKDANGLNQDVKIRLTASDGEAVKSTTQIESASFPLDTLDPPAPAVDPVSSPTSVRDQVLTGTKEEGVMLLLNEEAIAALGTGADWSHEVSLSEGENHFRFMAKDAFGNVSGTRMITIVLDTLPPDGSTAVVQINQTSPTILTLSWGAVIQDSIGNPETVEKYIIYRGTTADFEPTPDNLIAEITETTYTDSPVTFGDVDVNSFYAIEAVDAVDHRAWLANRVGEYEFRLHTTIGGDYTLISLPFSIEELKMASDLASYIENHTDKEMTVSSISYWNAEAQSYRGYTPIPKPFGDFEVSAGSAYQVEVRINEIEEANDNTIVIFVGKVPELRTFDLKTTTGTDYTWVSLPLGHTDVPTASQLKQNIETHSSPPTIVTTISYWNPVAQSYRTFYTVPEPFGDFPVKDGQAYQVEVTQNAAWSP